MTKLTFFAAVSLILVGPWAPVCDSMRCWVCQHPCDDMKAEDCISGTTQCATTEINGQFTKGCATELGHADLERECREEIVEGELTTKCTYRCNIELCNNGNAAADSKTKLPNLAVTVSLFTFLSVMIAYYN